MKYLRMVRVSGSAMLADLTLGSGSANAQCGGLCLYEVGTMDMGASGAGAGARAQDPGTVLFNPAGMSRLDDTQVHIRMINLISVDSFEFVATEGTEPNPPGSSSLFAGFSGGGDLGTYLPLAGAYATHQISERFHVGFAFFVSG